MAQRDKMYRCKVCKKLFKDDECFMTKNDGLQCPNKCEPIYNQPAYELPTNY